MSNNTTRAMTIQELLKRSGGVIEFDGICAESRIVWDETQGPTVQWFHDVYQDWGTGYCMEDLVLNAIISAHAEVLGVDEMLAALKAVANWDIKTQDAPMELITQVLAAINKAEGRG